MIEYELFVVDPVRASLWWGDVLKKNDVVSRGTSECDTANCRACGDLHGVADSVTLEKNGLAVRRV